MGVWHPAYLNLFLGDDGKAAPAYFAINHLFLQSLAITDSKWARGDLRGRQLEGRQGEFFEKQYKCLYSLSTFLLKAGLFYLTMTLHHPTLRDERAGLRLSTTK